MNYKTLLLAPTGRAAKVISGYSGKSAFTIHKVIYKLKADPSSGSISFTLQKNYNKNTLFVVDEASMLSDSGEFGSSNVLSDLLEFVFSNSNNKLLFVGDSAQLPPVGQTLSKALDPHFFESKGFKVYDSHLNEVMRQELNSGILKNATIVRDQIDIETSALTIQTKGYNDIFRIDSEKLEDGLRYGYDKFGLGETIIICRSNKVAVRYNQYIRSQILFNESEIDAGDMIMCVRNNYFYTPEQSAAGFIANGDILEIRKVYGEEERYGFRFVDLEVKFLDIDSDDTFEVKAILDSLYYPHPSIPQENSKELYEKVMADQGTVKSRKQMKEFLRNDPYLNALQIKFAYAFTCHKAQGGQWSTVFIDHGYMNAEKDNEYLRWIYTALTRASKELYLMNFPSDLF